MRDVVIVDSIRTGLAKAHRGSFNLTRSDSMVAHLVDNLLLRNPKIDPGEVEDLVLGVGQQTGEQGMNLARMAAVMSKLGVDVAGGTISRACSSGLNSIAIAANQIGSGCAEVIFAGGVESITSGTRGTPGESALSPWLLEHEPDIYMAMGDTAEVVAKRYDISREAQDEFSLQSQLRTAAAQEAGLFDDEICAMEVERKTFDKKTGEESVGQVTLARDECNRPGTTLEGLSALAPVFDTETGTVTAGNASQLADGASMCIVMSADRATQLGLEPMGYFRGFTVAGCEPDEMGIGPVFAVPRLLQAKGLTMSDIDLVELNEAFASQCLYSRDRLEIDPDIYNVNGGSIAIGHPFGMTGARLTGHLLRELKRRNKKYGIVSMCVGAGMGAAGLFEGI